MPGRRRGTARPRHRVIRRCQRGSPRPTQTIAAAEPGPGSPKPATALKSQATPAGRDPPFRCRNPPTASGFAHRCQWGFAHHHRRFGRAGRAPPTPSGLRGCGGISCIVGGPRPALQVLRSAHRCQWGFARHRRRFCRAGRAPPTPSGSTRMRRGFVYRRRASARPCKQQWVCRAAAMGRVGRAEARRRRGAPGPAHCNGIVIAACCDPNPRWRSWPCPHRTKSPASVRR